MRIRLAIYDSNIEFMTRLSQIFQQKYADKIDLSMFTNEDALYENLKEAHRSEEHTSELQSLYS